MDLQQILEEKEAVENKFNNLQRHYAETAEELSKLQGEYRALSSLAEKAAKQPDETKDKKKESK